MYSLNAVQHFPVQNSVLIVAFLIILVGCFISVKALLNPISRDIGNPTFWAALSLVMNLTLTGLLAMSYIMHD